MLWFPDYAGRFEREVAGLVIVDHASTTPIGFPTGAAASPATAQRLPIGRDSGRAFEKLPAPYYRLHLWADSLPTTATVMRRNVQMVKECEAEVAIATRDRTPPLGHKPFVAVSTQASEGLHKELLSLSANSKLVIASDSGHYIMIDRPDVVVESIREVVEAARTGAALRR